MVEQAGVERLAVLVADLHPQDAVAELGALDRVVRRRVGWIRRAGSERRSGMPWAATKAVKSSSHGRLKNAPIARAMDRMTITAFFIGVTVLSAQPFLVSTRPARN